MDLFQLLFFDIGLCSAVLTLEFYFFTRFTGNKIKPAGCAGFIALSYAAVYLSDQLNSPLLGAVMIIALLFFFGVGVYRVKWGISAVSAVLVADIMQLSFGLFNSITGICSPLFISKPHLVRWYVVVVSLFQIGLAFLCYRMINKILTPKGTARNQLVLLIFIPLMMISMAGEYISDTVYGAITTINSHGEMIGVNHIQMLVIQLFSILSIFCIAYVYRKLDESYNTQLKVSLLEQEKQHLRGYVDEAKSRYEQTRSFRHDIRNHLTIVKGLLERGDGEKACRYIQRLDDAAADISGSCSTNNPVIDIVLGSKLSVAKDYGVCVEYSLAIPSPCAVNDMELCVVFSNAMDNAIRACKDCNGEEHKYIRITDGRQGDFYMLDIVNGCGPNGGGAIVEGIGLSNIRAVCERHGGRMHVERTMNSFRLTVLFIITQHTDGISLQTG